MLSDSQLGEFTFCSHAGRTSVVDYLLLNYSDFDSISEFKILNFNEFSDHAPILFSIKTKTCAFQNSNDNHNTHAQSNITWEESKVTEFRHMLLNNIEPLHSVLDDVFNSTTNIDDVVTSFTSHLYERAHSIFGKPPHNFKNFNFSKSQINKSWFDKNCQNQRKEFNKIRNAFIKNKTDANKSQFTASRSKYNKIKRKAKLNFKISEGKRLQALAKKEPRKFGNL